MKRVLLLAVACLLLCTACRSRVDLTLPEETADPAPTSAAPTSPPPTLPQLPGEDMSDAAWEVYCTALEKEGTFTSYELTFETREIALGQRAVNRARILRREAGEDLRLLLEKNWDGKTDSGYFVNGIGYFAIGTEKYWMPTNEKTFFSEFGFTDSDTFSREMFADAILIDRAEGGAAVSCPLPEPYATAYVEKVLGTTVGIQVRRVSLDFIVDADGAPVEYLVTMRLWVSGRGEITYESLNRYETVGEEVEITPPEDLDGYKEK